MRKVAPASALSCAPAVKVLLSASWSVPALTSKVGWVLLKAPLSSAVPVPALLRSVPVLAKLPLPDWVSDLSPVMSHRPLLVMLPPKTVSAVWRIVPVLLKRCPM